MSDQYLPDMGPLADFLTYAILGGWLVMVLVPRFRYALLLAVCFGGVFGLLTHMLLSNRAVGGEVELWVPYGVVAPLAAVTVLLAWPIGALVRRMFGRSSRRV